MGIPLMREGLDPYNRRSPLQVFVHRRYRQFACKNRNQKLTPAVFPRNRTPLICLQVLDRDELNRYYVNTRSLPPLGSTAESVALRLLRGSRGNCQARPIRRRALSMMESCGPAYLP